MTWPATLLKLRTESAGLVQNPPASHLQVMQNGKSLSLSLCHRDDLNLPPAPTPATPPRILPTLPPEVCLTQAVPRTLEEILVIILSALRWLMPLRKNCLSKRKTLRVRRSPPTKYMRVSQTTSQDVRGSTIRNAGHLDWHTATMSRLFEIVVVTKS